MRCWNASLPVHLPLPRAVGPYTVIRCTKRFSSDASVVLIGTFKYPSGAPNSVGDLWTNIVAVESVDATQAINSADNTKFQVLEGLELGRNATLVPSALTVQVMNPEALVGTSGIIYGSVLNVQGQTGGSTQTYKQYGDNVVNFQTPRLMSAGKIALRGVTANSYPLNMAQVAEFTQIALFTPVAGGEVWDVNKPQPSGWSPIVFYNGEETQSSRPKLEYLVSVEFRVRFGLTNPASASHRQHPVAADSVWSTMISTASSFGHGIADIAEVVANTGSAFANFAGAGRAARAFAP